MFVRIAGLYKNVKEPKGILETVRYFLYNKLKER